MRIFLVLQMQFALESLSSTPMLRLLKPLSAVSRGRLSRSLSPLVSRSLVSHSLTSPRLASGSAFLRFNSTKSQSATDESTATLKVDNPQLMIAFTCKKCETRSSHVFSKQAYTKGSVLIQCPGCKGRHLIADNLKMFRDNNINLEEILKAKGESVATTTEDLAFEDIPELLRKTIGHHAKDAPQEYQKETSQAHELPEPKK